MMNAKEHDLMTNTIKKLEKELETERMAHCKTADELDEVRHELYRTKLKLGEAKENAYKIRMSYERSFEKLMQSGRIVDTRPMPPPPKTRHIEKAAQKEELIRQRFEETEEAIRERESRYEKILAQQAMLRANPELKYKYLYNDKKD